MLIHFKLHDNLINQKNVKEPTHITATNFHWKKN